MEVTINRHNINDYMNREFKDITKIIWKAGELNETIIKNFPNLQILYCGQNQITTLEPLIYLSFSFLITFIFLHLIPIKMIYLKTLKVLKLYLCAF